MAKKLFLLLDNFYTGKGSIPDIQLKVKGPITYNWLKVQNKNVFIFGEHHVTVTAEKNELNFVEYVQLLANDYKVLLLHENTFFLAKDINSKFFFTTDNQETVQIPRDKEKETKLFLDSKNSFSSMKMMDRIRFTFEELINKTKTNENLKIEQIDIRWTEFFIFLEKHVAEFYDTGISTDELQMDGFIEYFKQWPYEKLHPFPKVTEKEDKVIKDILLLSWKNNKHRWSQSRHHYLLFIGAIIMDYYAIRKMFASLQTDRDIILYYCGDWHVTNMINALKKTGSIVVHSDDKVDLDSSKGVFADILEKLGSKAVEIHALK